jgi:hypothetical protein
MFHLRIPFSRARTASFGSNGYVSAGDDIFEVRGLAIPKRYINRCNITGHDHRLKM